MSMHKVDGMWRTFTEIRPNESQARVATMLAKEAARRLQIPVPSIHFFLRQPYEKNFRGFCDDGNEIWIGTGMTDLEVCAATIHETRHAYHHRSPAWMERSEEQRERDAVLYELAWERW